MQGRRDSEKKKKKEREAERGATTRQRRRSAGHTPVPGPPMQTDTKPTSSTQHKLKHRVHRTHSRARAPRQHPRGPGKRAGGESPRAGARGPAGRGGSARRRPLGGGGCRRRRTARAAAGGCRHGLARRQPGQGRGGKQRGGGPQSKHSSYDRDSWRRATWSSSSDREVVHMNVCADEPAKRRCTVVDGAGEGDTVRSSTHTKKSGPRRADERTNSRSTSVLQRADDRAVRAHQLAKIDEKETERVKNTRPRNQAAYLPADFALNAHGCPVCKKVAARPRRALAT